ncbi:unnamed protein product [Nezara viridula]|uniref:Neuropeptide n=1 Tax=Nezara viridula TaxID=85310 RepID=A0A9P0HRT4_NEZVI|nr:unnamed protein product [Nezara viridula]
MIAILLLCTICISFLSSANSRAIEDDTIILRPCESTYFNFLYIISNSIEAKSIEFQTINKHCVERNAAQNLLTAVVKNCTVAGIPHLKWTCIFLLKIVLKPNIKVRKNQHRTRIGRCL